MLNKIFKFSLIALLLVTTSADEIETVDFTAGEWSSNTVISVVGMGEVHNETDQYCISEADSNPSVESLLAGVLEGDCELSNFEHTLGSASLNVTCRNLEDQASSEGSLTMTYTSTEYTATADAVITGPGGSSNVKVVTKAKRIGECR